jgi:hypothetical protein
MAARKNDVGSPFISFGLGLMSKKREIEENWYVASMELSEKDWSYKEARPRPVLRFGTVGKSLISIRT